MPKVPTYQPFQVGTEVRPGPAFSAPSGPTPTGIAAQQMTDFGQQLQGLSQAAAEMVVQEQLKQNDIRATDAHSQLMSDAVGIRQEYMQMKAGDVARGLEDPEDPNKPRMSFGEFYQQRFDELVNQYGADLQGVQAQQKYAELSNRLRLRFSEQLGDYEIEQRALYDTQVYETTIQSSFNIVADDPLADNEPYIAQAKEAAGAYLESQGYERGSEEYMVQMEGLMAKGHRGVIDALREAGRHTDAATYFATHRGDFGGAEALEVEAQLSAGVDFEKAVAVVDRLLAGGIGRNPSRTDLDRQLREAIGTGNAEMLRMARAEMDARLQDAELDYRAQDTDNYQAALDTYRNSGLQAAKLTPAYLELPATMQEQLDGIARAEARARNTEARQARIDARGAAADTLQDLTREYNSQYHTLLFGPEGYYNRAATLTDAEINAEGQYIGPDNVEKLYALREQRRKEPDYYEMTEEVFGMQAIRILGQKEGKKLVQGSSSFDEVKYAQFRGMVDDRLLEARRENNGNPLTRDQVNSVVAAALTDQVTVRVRGGRVRDVPVATLTRQQIRRLTVPNDVRAEIIDVLASRNPPDRNPSAETIKRYYFEFYPEAKGLAGLE